MTGRNIDDDITHFEGQLANVEEQLKQPAGAVKMRELIDRQMELKRKLEELKRKRDGGGKYEYARRAK